MKFLLGLGLLQLLYSAVYATPFIHFGRCVSSLSERAHCLPLEKCDYYRNQQNLTEATTCSNANEQKLICCPKISPVIKVQKLMVEAPTKAAPITTTTTTTEAPKIIETSKTTESPKTTEKPAVSPTPIVQTRYADINKLPQPPACGLMLSDRIYGGNETQLDEFPWVVLIEYSTRKGREFQCGGSLINDRWVLTAAHCITNLRNSRVLGVRLGEWNTETDIDCITNRYGYKECAPKPIDMAIDRQLPHPLYNQYRFHNDIALLRLAHPIAPSQFIKPICLPTKAELRTETFMGAKADVSGWGRTEHNDTKSTIKLKAQLDVLTLSYCRQKYDVYNVTLIENQMCAGGVLGVDSCGGDSGGPLILELPSSSRGMAFYQIGIVSFGKTNCGMTDTPGVYTRVGPYIDWIGTTIADNQN